MVYWYVESLCDLRMQLHAAAHRGALAQSAAALASTAPKKGPNKKKAKAPSLQKPAAGSAATRQELLHCAALRQLSCSIMLMLGMLRELRFIPTGDLEFTPLATRFSQRFAVFGSLIQPAPLPYERYLDMCVTKLCELPIEHLLAATSNSLKSAKVAVDKAMQGADSPPTALQKAELLSLAKVAVANRAVLAAQLEPLPEPESMRAAFDFSTHKCFPTLVLTKR